MSEPQPLTPRQEQEEHQAAILATIPRPKYKRIPSGEMVLDDDLNPQEGISHTWANFYRNHWVDALAGVLFVCKVGRRYVIIDGRHRWFARKGNPYMFDCLVWEGLAPEQMQALFQYFNQQRRQPGPMEVHRAAAAHGDPVALRVDKVLGVRGVTGEIAAISTCEAVVRKGTSLDDGEAALDFALRTLTAAFPRTDRDRLKGMLIAATARVYLVHGSNPKLHEDRIVKALNGSGKMTAGQLLNVGVGSPLGGTGRTAAIFRYLEEYHARLSGGNRL